MSQTLKRMTSQTTYGKIKEASMEKDFAEVTLQMRHLKLEISMI